ncbi:glycosyltransferase family 87 protein [Flavobacterium oreochromis]|uniref:glycosyltransferase family 87 protein n=1 Tax=Flavobacterium oreochromis TaxID=2906078 RepID=UPI00385815AF
MVEKIKSIFTTSFFKDPKYIAVIWIIISAISAIKQFARGSYNNYLIFKNVFWHTLEKQSLYAEYPNLYFDHNHYGPVFSLFIAPFAVLPDAIGIVLWNSFNAFLLVWAIFKLPLNTQKISLILWICLNEFITSNLGLQFNPTMTALILLTYVFIIEEKEVWAAFCIVLGLFVKLYGVVGLAFFFFIKNKLKFIAALISWSIILFVLPMLISSPVFVCDSYVEWFGRLVVKNSENASLASRQDISVMGMFRRISGHAEWSNLPFLSVGLILFGLPYLRWSMFKNTKFQLLLLASVLIFTVIFSSGSESPTYIIAFIGVAIWFVLKESIVTNADWGLFIFAILLTSFSPTDLFPKFIRETYINPYALKALPCVLIWLKIVYEMLVLNISNNNHVRLKDGKL